MGKTISSSLLFVISAPDYVYLYGFYAQKVQNYVENSTSEGDVYVQISSPLRKIQIKLRINFRPFTWALKSKYVILQSAKSKLTSRSGGLMYDDAVFARHSRVNSLWSQDRQTKCRFEQGSQAEPKHGKKTDDFIQE